ncbi:hypothetical protein GmHk_16G047154 [Glycine max]|nr:hypothetical protein GmHk_16G047154 [Glycine max]
MEACKEAIWLFYSFGGSSVIINNPQQNGKHQQKERSNATLFQEENCFGVRMIVGHHCGNFIKAQTLVHQGVPEPHKAESWGLLQAVIWINSLGMNNVTFELDCKSVVDSTSSSYHGTSEFSYINSINV